MKNRIGPNHAWPAPHAARTIATLAIVLSVASCESSDPKKAPIGGACKTAGDCENTASCCPTNGKLVCRAGLTCFSN